MDLWPSRQTSIGSYLVQQLPWWLLALSDACSHLYITKNKKQKKTYKKFNQPCVPPKCTYLVTHKHAFGSVSANIRLPLYGVFINSQQNIDLPVRYIRRLLPHMERATLVISVSILFFAALPGCVVSSHPRISCVKYQKKTTPAWPAAYISMPMMNLTSLLTKPNVFWVAVCWVLRYLDIQK